MLDWFNASLPDPVPAGRVLTIPTLYRASRGETLDEIAGATSVPLALLASINPQLDPRQALIEDEEVRMPKLYIVEQAALLADIAATLNTTVEAMVRANPELADQEQVTAGAVLAIPLNGEP